MAFQSGFRKKSKEPPTLSAFDQAVVYLAKRDHSEKELKKKLSDKGYTADEILSGIEELQLHRYLSPPEELAERVARQLDQKNKSFLFIKGYLAQKGLPASEKNPLIEIEKSKNILRQKLGEQSLTPELREKAGRWLASRGFDSDTIRKVIYEKS